MADGANVTGAASSTIPVHTDEVTDPAVGNTPRQVQYVKLMDGTPDSVRKAIVGNSGGLAVRGASVTPVAYPFAAAATGTAGPFDVSEAGNVTFVFKNTVAATAWTGNPVAVFEQTDDNTNWGPLQVVRASDGAIGSTFTLSPVGANGSLAFEAGVEAVTGVRCRITTGTAANGMTVSISAGGFLAAVVSSVIPKRDANRTPVALFMAGPIVTTAADALMSLTGYRAGAAVAATTTPAVVPAGRTLRLTHGILTFISVGTAGGGVRMNLRANPAGVVAVGSTPVTAWHAGSPAAVAGLFQAVPLAFPDGMEFPAGTGIGVTQVGLNATGTAAVNGYGQISLYGFEY